MCLTKSGESGKDCKGVAAQKDKTGFLITCSVLFFPPQETARQTVTEPLGYAVSNTLSDTFMQC